MPRFTIRQLLALALPLLGLAACSDAKTHAATQGADVPPAPQAVTVEVRPTTANVPPGTGYQFASAVTGTGVTAVTWTVKEGSGGGTVSTSGYYTAPATPGTYHVEATSQASPSAFAEATVTVPVPTAVVVTLSPNPGAVDACKTLRFTATVTGTTNTGVTWSVQEAAGGTVAAGTYTAPDVAGTYHVVATSVAQPTSSASVPVVVSDHVLGVAVTPAAVNVLPNGTTQFTATVTTSCGVFTSSQVVAVAQ